MKGYTKCNKGHFYKESESACPYCPSSSSGSSSSGSSTVVGGGQNTVMDGQKTETFGNATEGVTESFNGERTMVFTPGSGSQANSGSSKPSGGNSPVQNVQFDRTFIGGLPTESGNGSNESANTEAPRSARKIVGWIISYTIDPMGVDYRIFEGNNLIGRDPSNSIILSKESTISGRHATILYRSGKFWVKDEMSANGSFLNGEEMEIQKAYEMNDNDILRLGNTVFRFKSAE
jgi:hypothetical protein